MTRLRSEVGAVVAGGIGLFLLAGFLIFVVAPLLAKSPADVGDARTSAIQLIAGAVLAVGAVFTARTYQLNRTGQITERFTKAIGQLGDAKVEIRLGGIYALEQIAKEPGSNHHPQIMEVLTAYVREVRRLGRSTPSMGLLRRTSRP